MSLLASIRIPGDKLKLLEDFQEQLFSLSGFEDILNTTVKFAVELTRADGATVLLLEEGGKELYVRAQKWSPEDQAKAIRIRANIAQFITALETGKPTSLNAEKIATGFPAKSMLCFPLSTRKVQLGLLIIHSHKSGFISARG